MKEYSENVPSLAVLLVRPAPSFEFFLFLESLISFLSDVVFPLYVPVRAVNVIPGIMRPWDPN